jgi:hypothetical protein
MLRSLFEALPTLVFVVDRDVRIHECKATAFYYLMVEGMTFLNRRAGEIMYCIHAGEAREGCGTTPYCKECVVRASVTEALRGDRVVRRRTTMKLVRDAEMMEIRTQITASPVSFQNRPLVLLIIEVMQGG